MILYWVGGNVDLDFFDVFCCWGVDEVLRGIGMINVVIICRLSRKKMMVWMKVCILKYFVFVGWFLMMVMVLLVLIRFVWIE